MPALENKSDYTFLCSTRGGSWKKKKNGSILSQNCKRMVQCMISTDDELALVLHRTAVSEQSPRHQTNGKAKQTKEFNALYSDLAAKRSTFLSLRLMPTMASPRFSLTSAST
jgi:hypothetical protein